MVVLAIMASWTILKGVTTVAKKQNVTCVGTGKSLNQRKKKPSTIRPTKGKFECIDEMLSLFGIDAVMTFCKLNVYKYRFRANQKNGQEDIEKAEWYMTKLKELQWEKENDY